MNGTSVRALTVDLDRPAHLITLDEGVHQFSRVYVLEDGRVQTGDRADRRVGPATIGAINFDQTLGLTVHTDRGVIWCPSSNCLVTWRT